MSVRSMTGFGRGAAAAHGYRVEVELGCVNRKQLDISLNLPRAYAALEPRFTELVRGVIARGRVGGTLSVERDAPESGGVAVNHALAAACARRLQELARDTGISTELTLDTLARIPGVLEIEEVRPDLEAAWPVVRQAVEKALAGLVAMRVAEGKALEKDLRGRAKTLEALVRVIRKRAPAARDAHREAMRARLAEVGLDLSADDERLMKELLLYADRSDIAEELTRLASHLDQVRALIAADEPAGRTLDFLCQEMGREINTTGSKSQDSEIIHAVIAFKAELERLREQVQNIE